MGKYSDTNEREPATTKNERPETSTNGFLERKVIGYIEKLNNVQHGGLRNGSKPQTDDLFATARTANARFYRPLQSSSRRHTTSPAIWLTKTRTFESALMGYKFFAPGVCTRSHRWHKARICRHARSLAERIPEKRSTAIQLNTNVL